jgi:hypothetical protein
MYMKKECFDFFMNNINEETMMEINAPINCPNWWREYWKDVENEVRENLAELPDNIGRVNYLENLLERLNRELNYYKSEKYEGKLKALYIDYNITEDEINTHTGSDEEQYQRRTNLLFIALRNSRRDLLHNRKWDNRYIFPRECYFGYHLFTILSRAIEFVNERKREILGLKEHSKVPAPPPRPPRVKITPLKYKHFAQHHERLKVLLNSLKKECFVAKDTSVSDFKLIFGHKDISKDFAKVNWVGSPSSIHFFIDFLMEKELVTVNKKMNWKIVEKLFDCKGKPISSNVLNNNKSLSENKKEPLKKIIEILSPTILRGN